MLVPSASHGIARRVGPLLAAAAFAAAVPGAQAQKVTCESRDYRYQFCATTGEVEAAHLVEQRSRSACIEGRTWGWDRGGLWVDGGCDGVFEVRFARAAPDVRTGGDRVIACESRAYQYEFCQVPETILQAELLRQRSTSSCIEGRTWGWRANGIWVSGGCEGDFRYGTASVRAQPAPIAGQGLLYCESRDYGYTFCPSGRMRTAELVTQRSQAACVFGQSWGFQNDGVWVDRGCAAEFAVRPQ